MRRQAQANGNNEGGKEKVESKLSVIFQPFLQTAAFSYQNDPNEQEQEQETMPGEEEQEQSTNERMEPEAANGELD